MMFFTLMSLYVMAFIAMTTFSTATRIDLGVCYESRNCDAKHGKTQVSPEPLEAD